MEDNETVDAFASRVATMVNGIRNLDEKLEDISIVRRFLCAAPTRYMPIVLAVEQCVDLNTLALDDLVGRFKAHDKQINVSYGDTKQDEYLMLKRARWQVMVAKEKKSEKAFGRGSRKQAYCPTRKTEERSEKGKKKFDTRKIRYHNSNFVGHFKSESRKPMKEKALMAKEGDDRPMVLMLEVCELMDPGSTSSSDGYRDCHARGREGLPS